MRASSEKQIVVVPAMAVGILVLLFLSVCACGKSISPQVGSRAPDFTAQDLAGNPISLSQYRGKIVLLDFWATWCGPCVGELPHVKQVYSKYKNSDFQVIGVSLDENRSQLQSFIQTAGMEWPQIFDGRGWENEVSRLYNIYSIPSTFLIDRQGIIRYTNLRGSEALEKAVQNLIGPAPAPPSR